MDIDAYLRRSRRPALISMIAQLVVSLAVALILWDRNSYEALWSIPGLFPVAVFAGFAAGFMVLDAMPPMPSNWYSLGSGTGLMIAAGWITSGVQPAAGSAIAGIGLGWQLGVKAVRDNAKKRENDEAYRAEAQTS